MYGTLSINQINIMAVYVFRQMCLGRPGRTIHSMVYGLRGRTKNRNTTRYKVHVTNSKDIPISRPLCVPYNVHPMIFKERSKFYFPWFPRLRVGVLYAHQSHHIFLEGYARETRQYKETQIDRLPKDPVTISIACVEHSTLPYPLVLR